MWYLWYTVVVWYLVPLWPLYLVVGYLDTPVVHACLCGIQWSCGACGTWLPLWYTVVVWYLVALWPLYPVAPVVLYETI